MVYTTKYIIKNIIEERFSKMWEFICYKYHYFCNKLRFFM